MVLYLKVAEKEIAEAGGADAEENRAKQLTQ